MKSTTDRQINTVLLDADGVIQSTPDGWLERVGALCPEPARARDFLSALFAAERPCMKGQGHFETALDGVLKQWKSRASLNDALALWTEIKPDPEAMQTVARLRASGLTVALTTNQQAYRASHMLDMLGYDTAFDHTFFSCDLGHAKPEAGFFVAVLERLELAPHKALFVDDGQKNVEAARQVGLHAQHFALGQTATPLATVIQRALSPM